MTTIEKLVNEAHNVFSKTSVFEVIDQDKTTAISFLNSVYNFPDPKLIDRYLEILARLRPLVGNGQC